jgi:hypothetical protein
MYFKRLLFCEKNNVKISGGRVCPKTSLTVRSARPLHFRVIFFVQPAASLFLLRAGAASSEG